MRTGALMLPAGLERLPVCENDTSCKYQMAPSKWGADGGSATHKEPT